MKLLVKLRYEEIDPERSVSLVPLRTRLQYAYEGHVGALRRADRSREAKALGMLRRMKSTRCKDKRHRIAFGSANVYIDIQ